MKVSVIVIGDELLIGQVVDTNSGWIARHISPYGWEVNDVQTVGDNADEIRRSIDRAFELSSVVLTTGGLGPTKDDITKSVLCDYFGGEMVTDNSVTENVNRIFARRGIKMNPLTAAQAIVPSSCRVIQNRVGTAPIMWFEREDGKVLVSMPGVPFETSTMMSEAVFPALRERFPSPVHIEHAVLMVTDYTESGLAMKISAWEESLPEHLHLAYLPKPGLIRLRLDGHHEDVAFIRGEVARELAVLKDILGPAVLADEDLTPAEILLKECIEKGVTISTAESCTGGNIAHELTLIPGASEVVNGGVVSYSNGVKVNVLGVSAADIDANGAVSIPVVRQMAAGAQRAASSRLAVATSGIAGPGGGSEEKPVGTVCICARLDDKELYETAHFNGSRARIIDSATTRALILAIKLIKEL
ncbi:CinA family nicotinamide mononucleotide deamidase-related protein [Duncaniella freteri]|jgi:nicotinamide-nucleotide amidase|uniref:CinA family nicotinamide mononucleotide deamidase-related protein n=3 Tax=Duncaniella TaxID=2518495 RepID=UPI00136D11EC|nr:CinA family nicotinamide mononucleotide deamidase-related protein [Duncaniella freteri]NBJ06188.1 CinA family nicotinamide mononucleotide deamidase-related protein [Alistipes sp. Z76]NCE68225.1 CinA family nicotinamide mononucleotide deamidase-related protein [Muribaculaceae bacterium M3]